MESKFYTLINYLNTFKEGDIIRRFDIFFQLKPTGLIGGAFSTIDTYRNYLTKAGYLERVGQGKYKLIKKIPNEISVNRVVFEAYKETPISKVLRSLNEGIINSERETNKE